MQSGPGSLYQELLKAQILADAEEQRSQAQANHARLRAEAEAIRAIAQAEAQDRREEAEARGARLRAEAEAMRAIVQASSVSTSSSSSALELTPAALVPDFRRLSLSEPTAAVSAATFRPISSNESKLLKIKLAYTS